MNPISKGQPKTYGRHTFIWSGEAGDQEGYFIKSEIILATDVWTAEAYVCVWCQCIGLGALDTLVCSLPDTKSV